MRDRDIRPHLHMMLKESLKEALIVDELGICQGSTRIDVAAVDDSLHGYEIKSAKDTLVRLPSQIISYSKVLDFASLVVSSNHLEEARSILPPFCGIYLVNEDLTIDTLQAPQPNPNVDKRALAELLWHADTLELLEVHNASTGLHKRARKHAWDRLCKFYSLDEIRAIVRSKVRDRRDPPPPPQGPTVG